MVGLEPLISGGLLLLGTGVGYLLLWALGTVVALGWWRSGPLKARLGLGPRMAAFSLFEVQWELRLIPLGAAVWYPEDALGQRPPLPGPMMWMPHGLAAGVAGSLASWIGPDELQAGLTWFLDLAVGHPVGLWTAIVAVAAQASEAPAAVALAVVAILGLFNTVLGLLQALGMRLGWLWISPVLGLLLLGLLCRGCWIELSGPV